MKNFDMWSIWKRPHNLANIYPEVNNREQALEQPKLDINEELVTAKLIDQVREWLSERAERIRIILLETQQGRSDFWRHSGLGLCIDLRFKRISRNVLNSIGAWLLA